MIETLAQKIERLAKDSHRHIQLARLCFNEAADFLDERDLFAEADLMRAFRRMLPETPQYVLDLCGVATMPNQGENGAAHLRLAIAKQCEMLAAQKLLVEGNARKTTTIAPVNATT